MIEEGDEYLEIIGSVSKGKILQVVALIEGVNAILSTPQEPVQADPIPEGVPIVTEEPAPVAEAPIEEPVKEVPVAEEGVSTEETAQSSIEDVTEATAEGTTTETTDATAEVSE